MKGGIKHVPLRTCVICGNRSPKRELTRIVASKDRGVHVDTTGKRPGRGAYVCRDGACLQRPLKKGRLEYALRSGVEDEDWSRLVATLEAEMSRSAARR